MRAMNLRHLTLATLALAGTAIGVACSPTAPYEPPPEADAAVADTGSAKDSGSTKDTAPNRDVIDTTPDTSTPDVVINVQDTGTDAPVRDGGDGGDAGPPRPQTGDACAIIGNEVARPCGMCGTESALCENDKKIGAFGACIGAVVNGCMPGSIRQGACGLCGTRNEVCQNSCTWQGGACQNEPAGACTPGEIAYTAAGCPAGEFRKKTCDNTCAFSVAAACAPKAFPTLTLGAVNSVASQSFAFSKAADAIPIIPTSSGNCPLMLDAFDDAVFTYVKIVNPNATAARIELFTDVAAANAAGDDTMMAIYSAIPTTDAQRNACVGRYADGLEGTAATFGPECAAVDPGFVGPSGFCGDAAVTVPANGSIFVYVQSYETAPSNAEQNVKLTAKVRSL
jgi:hypothetical protein